MKNQSRFANPVNVINSLDDKDFRYSISDLQNAKKYAKMRSQGQEVLDKIEAKIKQVLLNPLREQPHSCSCQDHMDEDIKHIIQFRAGIIK